LMQDSVSYCACAEFVNILNAQNRCDASHEVLRRGKRWAIYEKLPLEVLTLKKRK